MEDFKEIKTVNVLPSDYKTAQNRFMIGVYGWMSLALVITGITSLIVASNVDLIAALIVNKLVFYGLIIAEFAVVGWMVARINTMSYTTAVASFVGYSILNGITLSIIFLAYTASSIATTFFITAGTFAVMTVFGYLTKSDLTKIGQLFIMLLFGLIIASVVNIFLNSPTLYWVTTYLGVIIFVGLIAYDTQKIKNIYFQQAQGDAVLLKKASILGALSLYLDFINLFLFLLRLYGRRR